MTMLHRRSFLERLGLGAGAFVLSPVIKGLVKEARGATTVRKRFIVITYSNGAGLDVTMPPEYVTRATRFGGSLLQVPNFTLPAPFKPLEPHRSRLLYVDGLVNRNGNGGHFAGDLLTCAKKAGGGPGSPGGKSFDQHVAGVIGKSTPFASVHLGSLTGADGWPQRATQLVNAYFAKAAGQPIPVHTHPKEAFAFYFPKGGGSSGAKLDQSDRRKLLDFIAEDIKRARQALAPTERAKLDQHLAGIEESQRRLDVLEAAGKGGSCGSAPGEEVAAVEPDDVFETQMQLGTSAVTCGLTNVLTVSFLGIGGAFRKRFGFNNSLHNIGHGREAAPGLKYIDGYAKYITWYSSLVAKMVTTLSAFKEGDNSIFDQSVILFANDNAESHHTRCWRYPVILLGDAGGALKANNRYIRYPTTQSETPKEGPAGMRSIGDLMSTLGHALGTPVDNWGSNGGEAAKGPLGELLVG